MQLTCLTGAYHLNDFDTLDESLVRSPHGGAIASLGSTGFGVLHSQTVLGEGLLDTIYVKNEPTLGPAILAGLLNAAGEQQAQAYLLDTSILLGDPTLRVNLKIDREIYLPFAVAN